ncbi:MAG: PQQ-binding-like beta-propeller repeat protein [Planctomyces sp.]|nr:PQQ-binding-like beta-propeller repeat protein [Planctomyces sp.]
MMNPSATAASLMENPRTSWPSFRGTPDQRGIAGCSLAANPQPKWEVKSKDGWVGTATIAGNHVYAPALEGYIYCLDRETGRELWKYRSIESVDPKEFAPGFKAAPLITDGIIYAGDEDGVMHAIKRDSGALAWKFATGAEIAGCVAQYEDRLLLASHDAFLYCLSMSGEEVWKFQTNDRINCSPAIIDHFTFLAGCDEHLRIIDVVEGKEVRDIPLESFLIASPAIVGDYLYVGTHTGDVVSVNWKTGDIQWRYKNDRAMPFHASAAVTDQLVLVGGHDKTMHAINRATGEGIWTFATKARIESSAVVAGDRVFFGSGDGNLYGLLLENGQEVWKFNGGKPFNAGLAVGEGCLVIGEDTQNGRLRCFA